MSQRISWHDQLPVHESTSQTIVDFLKATAPTPVYGKNHYVFRFNGTAHEAEALRNQLRVALTRIRNKAKSRGLAIYPFTMIVAEPETHTIAGATFHVIKLSRQVYTRNPFENILDAHTVLAVADREHPPTKMIADMIETLLRDGELQINLIDWQELTSAMWLVAHDYVKPVMREDAKTELATEGSIEYTGDLHATFLPIYRNNHINTVNQTKTQD